MRGVRPQGPSEARTTDVEILQPVSTSDYLTFCTSEILKKLTAPDFLAKGLTLFGDNAYVNCDYMTTPFKGVKSLTLEDVFNYYHSSMRIHI